MKYNYYMASGLGDDSRWDEKISCELGDEIERIDRANRRKRKALRELTKAIEERNERIEELEDHIEYLEERIDDRG